MRMLRRRGVVGEVEELGAGSRELIKAKDGIQRGDMTRSV